MSKASVFVLSSDTEGLPGALLEALACGIQVVATDCKTGPREILQDGRWGKLTPVGDRHRMAQAIEDTLRSKVKIDTRARAEDFSKARALDAYADILSTTAIPTP